MECRRPMCSCRQMFGEIRLTSLSKRNVPKLPDTGWTSQLFTGGIHILFEFRSCDGPSDSMSSLPIIMRCLAARAHGCGRRFTSSRTACCRWVCDSQMKWLEEPFTRGKVVQLIMVGRAGLANLGMVFVYIARSGRERGIGEGLHRAALRRTTARDSVPGSLHPSSGHRQWTDPSLRRRPGYLSLA